MARRRKATETEVMENVLPEPPVQETPASDRRRRPRIIIPLNDDGSPDISRLDPSVLDVLRTQAQDAGPEPIHPAVCDMAITVIANIEAAVLAPRMGVDPQTAAQITQPPEPLRGQIAETAAKVLSKYSGALGRWQDEIVLAALIAGWQIQVLNNLRAAKTPEVMTEKAEDIK